MSRWMEDIEQVFGRSHLHGGSYGRQLISLGSGGPGG